VPDIIVGIVNDPNANFINVNTIISASSVFYIAIYLLILVAILKYAIQGCIKLSIFEYILNILTIIVMVVVAVDHFYSLFEEAIVIGGEAKIAAVIVEMVFFLLCAGFIVITYFAYYKKKYTKRLKTNPKTQQTLDYEFRTLDG
jgi:threonine/homoserine/homoserine lactone efflux protein